MIYSLKCAQPSLSNITLSNRNTADIISPPEFGRDEDRPIQKIGPDFELNPYPEVSDLHFFKR